LPNGYPLPVIVVQHLKEDRPSLLVEIYRPIVNLEVEEAREKLDIKPGTIYFAPPGYHVHVEKNHTLSLSDEDRVQYSRPSIDVLFETASEVYRSKLLGIVLTGANEDGAKGLKTIKDAGGFAIVQDPASATVSSMPLAAIREAKPDLILSTHGIIKFLLDLA
jgi:two-component system chemotaxis response regulator CheB